MPIVSVIIPNYNHGKYLDARIKSVLDQVFQDFEVIILDDCSTDNSREIIEKYRHHPNVSHIVYNEKNSGSTFKQWNKGFELAQGKYVWIAESDDYCEPSFLTELVPAFLADEDVILSFCQSMLVTDSGKILSIMQAPETTSICEGKNFVLEKMMGRNNVQNASMAVFKKSALERIPTDYMKMRYCGDWLFWTYICLEGKVHVSGKVLNYYRRHDGTVASNAIKEGLDFIEGNKVFEYLKNYSPNEKQIESAMQQKINLYLFNKRLYDSSVKKSVLNSLKEIKPGIEKDIFRTELRQFVREIKNRFFNDNHKLLRTK